MFGSIIKKIAKKIKFRLIDKPVLSIANYKYNKFLNNGERYDPDIASMINCKDLCHVARYEFAKTYLLSEDIVLDMACGTGYGTKLLSNHCQTISGVDISSVAIKYAKSKYRNKNIEFIVGDFFSYTKKADAVISFETIEHIKYDGNFADIIQKLADYSNRIVIGSVPYKEKMGNNKYHYFFGIDEGYFVFLRKSGNLSFFYQTNDGKIYSNEPSNNIQNLIFVFAKDK